MMLVVTTGVLRVVQSTTELTGDGSAGEPLGIAQQGATDGQVLKWNDANSAWEPSDDNDSGGDDWGSQVVQSTTAITGDGTGSEPLGLAQQGATDGQILKWNDANSAWEPGDDLSDQNSYAAGTGIDITGSAPNFTIENTGDLSTTNEIQTLSLVGDTLNLSNGGGQVVFPPTNTYAAGNGIDITGTAPNFTIENIGDDDSDPANELQSISLSPSGDTLNLSNGGGQVLLPSANNYTAGNGIAITGSAPDFTIENLGDADADSTNELQTLMLNGKNLSISGTNSEVSLDTVLTTAGIGLWEGVGINIHNGKYRLCRYWTGHAADSTTCLRETVKPSGFKVQSPPLALLMVARKELIFHRVQEFFSISTSDSSSIVMATGGGKLFAIDGLTGNVGVGGFNTSPVRMKVSHDNSVGGLMIENTLGAFWEFRVDALTGGNVLVQQYIWPNSCWHICGEWCLHTLRPSLEERHTWAWTRFSTGL